MSGSTSAGSGRSGSAKEVLGLNGSAHAGRKALVIVTAIVLVAYLAAVGAVYVWAVEQVPDKRHALTYWRHVAVRPAQVIRIVKTEEEVGLYTLGIMTLVWCAGALWLTGKAKIATRPEVSSQYGSHGTSRWAEPEEVVRNFAETGQGAVLGRLRVGGRWRTVIYPWSGKARNRFVLIVGPPGSGKTSRYSLPNLLHAAAVDRDRSLVLTDPKGEMFRQMAALLKEREFEIRVINLIHPKASDRYNPMDYVRSVEDAFRLANTIIANTSGQSVTGDAFWVNAERSLLACLIWYVKTALKPEFQHLATVLHLGTAFGKDPELMEWVFAAKELDPIAKQLYGLISGLSSKTRDGVFIGFSTRLQLWASPEIAAMTAGSDFQLGDLGRRRIALFLVIPDHHSTYQALTSLFFDQAFQELITEADEQGGRLPFEVRMMLEEMANIGRIPDLEKRLATIRSRGLLVEMILQTVGQLKALYGEAWNTITGCSDTIVALAANDQETAEWISKRLGTMTIRTTSTSSTATDKGDSRSQSYHYTSRALMLSDEVQGQGEGGLDQDELIVIQRGLPPARLGKYPVDDFPGQEERTPMEPRMHRTKPRPSNPVPLPKLPTAAPRDREPAQAQAESKQDAGDLQWLHPFEKPKGG